MRSLSCIDVAPALSDHADAWVGKVRSFSRYYEAETEVADFPGDLHQ
jgi:hypothetical protein